MWQRKRSGNVLMGTILAAIVMIFVANAYFTTLGGSFQILKSSRTAQQAQQFAEIEANTLKLADYDEIDSLAHPRRSLTGVIDGADGWEDTITIGDEKTIGDNKQRIASIEIYKVGDTLARYRLQVPLSSQGSSIGCEAIGTIVPRLNDNFESATEASKYLYCDGSIFSSTAYPKLAALIGTTLPDLRDRVLQGNDVGGTRIEAGLPNIIGYGLYLLDPGVLETTGGGAFSVYGKRLPSNIRYTGTLNLIDDWDMVIDFNASRCSPIYGRSATVQPPAVTVRYYIRAK